MQQWKLSLVVAVWFIAVLAALLMYGNDAIKPFDPEQKLATLAASVDFDRQLVSAMEKKGISSTTVVHITDSNPCYCDSLSEQHNDSLQQQLSGSDYQFTKLVVDEELSPFFSRYPAVAIIDESMQLRYLGPYASGAGCWVGDDTVMNIARLAKAERSLGAVITTDVKGCYCPFST